ncbi:hypothetical protein GCM10023195_35960 [Actinoallomurus liliacearum]|uniref:Uncharacterized protein n=1 Tax=Actinoallomurus liliacearum TaxID=1080073 RepID=A0ABP8TM75_9ACTN
MRTYNSGPVDGLTSAFLSLSPTVPGDSPGRECVRASFPIPDHSHGFRPVRREAGWVEIVADTDAPGRLIFLEVAR